MPTPAERQALLFFAAIAALGVGVNAWRAVGGQAAPVGSRAELAAQIARVDSAVASSPSREARAQKRGQGRVRRGTITLGLPPSPAARSPAGRAARPEPPRKVDLDADSATAIEALPRIGPALAARIVANRDSFGAFGSLEGLTRVRGIGPSMTKALKDLVVFSGVPRADAPSGAGKGRRRRAMP
ncbi:MAG: ComEA family DNA-binding protein [Gemmatimonadaceae bacterium]